MTRGQIAVVLPDGNLLTSVEFNGDMYLSCHGKNVVDGLIQVNSEEDYRAFVEEFNEKNFQYSDRPLFFACDDSYFDMSTDYFDKWFSDYVYIKNLSNKPVVFTDSQGRKIKIDSDTVCGFNFGEFLAADEYDFACLTFADELQVMKNNLGYDMEENYCHIWNACVEFDNVHDVYYTTDKITNYDFVTEDILEYIVKENATDLSRLRGFINNTYADNIYMLDGCGNLRNVDADDFENLIDNIISVLQDEVTIPLYEGACL